MRLFLCNSDDPISVCLMTMAREAASFAGSLALLSQMAAAMERGELDPVDFVRACDDYADKSRFGVYSIIGLRNEAKIEARKRRAPA